MRLRVAGIVEESFVDGPGIRFVVFAQGCPHRCPGCHNPQTHAYEGGFWVEVGELLLRMVQNPLLDGLSLSGGEPFEQAEPLAELAEGAQARGYFQCMDIKADRVIRLNGKDLPEYASQLLLIIRNISAEKIDIGRSTGKVTFPAKRTCPR